MPNGMVNADISYQSINGFPGEHILKKLLDLYATLFSDADLDFFKNRLIEHPTSFTVLAYELDRLVGFKIGYPYNDHTFYSWIGGVHPDHRRVGIASKLAAIQEDYARSSGYSKLRTKSMNQYRPMMILNLKSGFDIVQFYTNTRGQSKIVFEKSIN